MFARHSVGAVHSWHIEANARARFQMNEKKVERNQPAAVSWLTKRTAENKATPKWYVYVVRTNVIQAHSAHRTRTYKYGKRRVILFLLFFYSFSSHFLLFVLFRIRCIQMWINSLCDATISSHTPDNFRISLFLFYLIFEIASVRARHGEWLLLDSSLCCTPDLLFSHKTIARPSARVCVCVVCVYAAELLHKFFEAKCYVDVFHLMRLFSRFLPFFIFIFKLSFFCLLARVLLAVHRSDIILFHFGFYCACSLLVARSYLLRAYKFN